MPAPDTPLPPGYTPLKDPPAKKVSPIAWAVVAAVVLLAAWRCGSLITGPADDDRPATRRSTATATTARRTTTTLSHSLQCRDDAADIQSSTYLVGLEIDNFVQAVGLGDVVSAQVHYENAVLLGEVAISEVDEFLSRCANYARSEGIYNELRQGSGAAKSALAEMRRTCRAGLAQFGFDC